MSDYYMCLTVSLAVRFIVTIITTKSIKGKKLKYTKVQMCDII